MTRIIGIDISTVKTGVALPDGRTTTVRSTITVHDDDPPIVSARRARDMANGVILLIRRLPQPPDVAVIENYLPASGGRSQKTMKRLVEVGGCVRMGLAALELPFVEVYPAWLKQFATGKGGASKEEMVHAARNLGGEPANDDEADAFLLRHLGLSHYGDWDGLSELQRNILLKLPFPDLRPAPSVAR